MSIVDKNMTKEELKTAISEFYVLLMEYRELLAQSRDATARIVRNGTRLEEMRSNLNRKFGRISKYAKKIGNDPYSQDIGGGPYPVYETALSTDILQRRGPCIDTALQDLDFILGRLESISDEEFDSLFLNTPQPQQANSGIIATGGGGGGGGGGPSGGRGGDGGSVTIGIPPEQVGIQHVRSPHKQYWKMLWRHSWRWASKHTSQIIIGVVIIVIGAIIVAYLGLNR